MSQLNTNANTAKPSQKSWNSEHLSLPAGSSKRYSNSSLLPFLNGRTMPSKWDDAEKWIFNPISSEAQGGSPFLSLNHYRRPMSKSGPLRAPTTAKTSYLVSSPQLHKRVSEDISKRKSFPLSSPFLTGVFMADNGCYTGERERGGERKRMSSPREDHSVVQNGGVHLWSDLSSASSSSSEIFQDNLTDDRLDAMKADQIFSSEVQRKDAGTQISPDGSGSSSPKERPLFSLSSSSLSTSIGKIKNVPGLEIRDVQVDKAQMESINKKNRIMAEPRASSWKICESEKSASKLKREEERIAKWENLQKAKAEAAIKRLEMKLEKKRSASMEKIMRDLRSAQEKARDMRNKLESRNSGQKKTKMKVPICLFGCFTYHAS